jgi:hypothetical protein
MSELVVIRLLRGLEIDDEFKLCQLLNWRSAGCD